MKKEISMILLAILVVITVVFWFTSTAKEINLGVITMYGAIILVVGFALFVATSRIKAVKSGLAPEDELSKKILQKTAALSYYVSLYWWLILMYFSDRIKLENHTLIGVGILGMAILFAVIWFFFNFKGEFNE